MTKIIYLDAAASSLKPKSVIDSEVDFLVNHYSNSGRGICVRSDAVDKMLNAARIRTADFIGARPENIIFSSGATDGLNRIMRILDASNAFGADSRIMVSALDHHSARLPWEDQARQGKCKIVVAGLDENFNITLQNDIHPDVFVITAMSNVLGRAQDVKSLITAAKLMNPGVITIVDAAQYVAHMPIDVTDWDCDFLCFSGHKIGADTGLGVMYVKDPSCWTVDKFGGGMVARVFEKTDNKTGTISEWNVSDTPEKFEAGTLPLTQIAGLPAAMDYLVAHGDNHELIEYMHGELSKVNRLKILTNPGDAVMTFVIDDMHFLDFGARIGARGVCLRVGNMCASWIHHAMGLDGTIRISVGPLNTMDEIIQTIDIIQSIVKEK